MFEMLENWTIYEWLLLTGLLGCIAVMAVSFFRSHREKKNSSLTKVYVADAIRGTGRLRSWKSFRDVTLSEGKDSVTVDHLIVGPFGIMVVNVLHHPGVYYGELGDEMWICTDAGEHGASFRKKVENPVAKGEKAESIIRRTLTKNGVTKIRTYSLSVFSQSKLSACIAGVEEKVLSLSDFKANIKRDRFDTDNGVDIEKVVGILLPVEK